MGMPDLARRWTRDDLLALPDDGNRYELFDGELLVTPAPTGLHQMAVTKLFWAVGQFVRQHNLGETFQSPADLDLGADQWSQPDVFVVPFVPPDRDWRKFPLPLLVVEVLSPSTARADRTVKRRRFQRAGIPEYWIVDLDARTVERWRPDDARPELLDERLIWRPEGAPVALELDLPELFRQIHGA
jgi:Uma2 family endonuclease